MSKNNAVNLGPSTFCAQVSAPILDVTGDGTAYNVVFDDALINQGSCYNAATGVFTAPYAGNYQFNVTIGYAGFAGSGCNWAGILMDHYVTLINPANCAVAAGDLVLSASTIINMVKGGTLYVRVQASGGTKTIDIATTSFFSGSRIL